MMMRQVSAEEAIELSECASKLNALRVPTKDRCIKVSEEDIKELEAGVIGYTVAELIALEEFDLHWNDIVKSILKRGII